MLTINAEIKSDGKRLDGTYNVKLRFTLNRKHKRISTSLFVIPKDLTKEFKIKASPPIKKGNTVFRKNYTTKQNLPKFTKT